MNKFVLTVFLIVVLYLPLHAEEVESLTAVKPQLSREDHPTVLLSVIAALQAEIKTLNLRVAAISQLLAANQRREIDQKAQAAVLETQKKILSGMGLSVTECLINLDGSVDCKPSVKVEE